MATSDVKVTPGSGANVATYSFSEDAETKQIQRVTLNKSAGTELIGQTTMAGSVPVTLASDQTYGYATGSAVPARAQYAGFDAATALPTAATAGNLVGAMADKFGRQVMLPVTVRDLVGTQTTTISASTAETTIVSQAASVFNDLLCLIVSNTSASTNTRIDFRDTTGGSVIFSLESIGGAPPVGIPFMGVPIPQTTVNTNWTAQCAASTTDIRIFAVFVKNR